MILAYQNVEKEVSCIHCCIIDFYGTHSGIGLATPVLRAFGIIKSSTPTFFQIGMHMHSVQKKSD